MPIHFLLHRHNIIYRQFIEKCLQVNANRNINRIIPHLHGQKILDIGLGAGITSKYLKNKGYRVVGIDVVDISLYPDTTATLYDGSHIPYQDKEFDTSLLLHVLHHCRDKQEAVLREAVRTSKRTIIIEDTYSNWFEQFVTNIHDCLGNFEFYRHPYHTVSEWQKIFSANHLKLIEQVDFYRRPWYFPIPVHYCLFVLE